MIPRGLTARIAGFHPAGPGSTPGVGNIFALQLLSLFILFIFLSLTYLQGEIRAKRLVLISLTLCHDEVAEWLRRWTANPMGSARVGSNPIFVEIFSSTNSL